MSSDAGEAPACRRRDLSISSSNLRLGFCFLLRSGTFHEISLESLQTFLEPLKTLFELLQSPFFVSPFFVSLPQRVSKSCDRGWRQSPILFQPMSITRRLKVKSMKYLVPIRTKSLRSEICLTSVTKLSSTEAFHHRISLAARALPPHVHQLNRPWLSPELSDRLTEALGPPQHALAPTTSLTAHVKTLIWLEITLNGLDSLSQHHLVGPAFSSLKPIKVVGLGPQKRNKTFSVASRSLNPTCGIINDTQPPPPIRSVPIISLERHFSLVLLCERLILLALFRQYKSGCRASLPRSVYDSLMSSSNPLEPVISAWSSRVLLGSRILVSSELLEKYLCRGQLLSFVRMSGMLSSNGESDPTIWLTLVREPIPPICHLPPKDRKLGSVSISQGQTGYKLCVEFLNLHGQELHVREDPPALLRFHTILLRIPAIVSSRIMRYVPKSLKDVAPLLLNPLLLAKSPLSVSPMKHSFTSSNALLARAAYDHMLVEDFVKPNFKDESALVPTDFSNIVKLLEVENPFEKLMEPLSLLSFVYLESCCMNSLLLKF